MKMSRDPHTALANAIIKSATTASISQSSSRPWASITFAGLTHSFTVRFGGHEAEVQARSMAARISCDEFDIRGHLVADISAQEPVIDGDTATIEIEALTVEAN